MSTRNLFVNRVTGSLCRIDRIDASFATLSVIAPTPSKYMMPIKEYDVHFIRSWRPAKEADFEALNAEPSFRLPLNAPSGW